MNVAHDPSALNKEACSSSVIEGETNVFNKFLQRILIFRSLLSAYGLCFRTR